MSEPEYEVLVSAAGVGSTEPAMSAGAGSAGACADTRGASGAAAARRSLDS
jgi:hypothetical protein